MALFIFIFLSPQKISPISNLCSLLYGQYGLAFLGSIIRQNRFGGWPKSTGRVQERVSCLPRRIPATSLPFPADYTRRRRNPWDSRHFRPDSAPLCPLTTSWRYYYYYYLQCGAGPAPAAPVGCASPPPPPCRAVDSRLRQCRCHVSSRGRH